MDIYSTIMLGVLSLAFILAFLRILMGPTLADRVIAFDLSTAIGVALSAVHAVTHKERVFLDVAVVLALVSFVGTVAFSRYLEKKVRQ